MSKVTLSKLTAVAVVATLATLSLRAQNPETAPTNSPVEIDKTVVSDKEDTLAPPTSELAEQKLQEIAGGASIVTSDAVQKSRVATVSDVLAFQPGVYAQTAQGSDGIKISIRGSGINRGTGFFRSGTEFYFDGLPLTGAGGTPYELLEPLGINYTEILRGGNAFDFGSIALGGAINFTTDTGYDAPGTTVRIEAGSFSYIKAQVAEGGVRDRLDYYVSLTASYRKGYQYHSQSQAEGIVANFGYKLSDNVETRLYIRHRRTDNETPGALRQKDIDEDPSEANPQNVQQNARRLQPGSTWIGSKTTFKLPDDASFVLGFVYHDYPIVINPEPQPGTVVLPANGADGAGTINPNAILTSSVWWYSDFATSLTYARHDDWDDHRSNTTLALLDTFHPAAGVRVYDDNPNLLSGANAFGTVLKEVNYNGSADVVIRFSNDTELATRTWLTTGLALASTRRVTQFTYVSPSVPLPTGYRNRFDRTENHLLPRIGLRYEVDPHWSFFGNITRTDEPPNSWSPSSGSGFATAPNLSNGYLIADMKDQTATTYEVGTRAQQGIFQGSLSVYHSDVTNELLTVQVDPGPPPITRELNGTPTKKEGVELGIDTALWTDAKSGDPFKAKNRVILRQAFTVNSFHYKHDPTYAANVLPGIPRVVYQGEVDYQHQSGFHAGFTVLSASSAYEDYANTFKVRPFTVLGAKVGYDDPKGRWAAFVDFENLTNKHYTVSISPIFDTRQNPTAPATTPAGRPNDLRNLSPGDGFGVFTGITFHL